MLRGIFAGGPMWVGGLVLTLLAIIFIGMGATVLSVTQGESNIPQIHFPDRVMLAAPPMLMLLVVLGLGLYLPELLQRLLEDAAALLEVKP